MGLGAHYSSQVDSVVSVSRNYYNANRARSFLAPAARDMRGCARIHTYTTLRKTLSFGVHGGPPLSDFAKGALLLAFVNSLP